MQGVGFRPFVHGLATGLGLSGLVGNDAGGVFIEVEGAPDVVGRFLDGLRTRPPRLAVVERVTTRELRASGRDGFAIVGSDASGSGARSSPGTPRPATTASANSATPPTAATGTRSSTARTAGRASRS